jgi:hypothetical protein
MSAESAAKELIRVATTAGLSKDVIDLLEKKASLLVEENAVLASKISRLEIENGQLKTQLQNSQPVVGRFHEFGGVLWKRTEKGFEKFPYCKECAHHPVMMAQPPLRHITPMFWSCSNGHTAPYAGLPEN